MHIENKEEEAARIKLEEIEYLLEREQPPSPLFMRHKMSSYPNIRRAQNINKRSSLPLPNAKEPTSDTEASFLTQSDDNEAAIENGINEFIFFRTNAPKS
jgi:hypothetical protein